jgi:hypothetical protein
MRAYHSPVFGCPRNWAASTLKQERYFVPTGRRRRMKARNQRRNNDSVLEQSIPENQNSGYISFQGIAYAQGFRRWREGWNKVVGAVAASHAERGTETAGFFYLNRL